MTELVLTGLDGANPLGLFAALGILNVLHYTHAEVRLGWRDEGAWRPLLVGLPQGQGRTELIAWLLADRDRWRAESALQLRYGKRGQEQWDLKPPQEKMRSYLQELVGQSAFWARRGVDLAAAFGSDVVQDRSEQTKPTALHFTAGQQQFLKSVGGLLEGLGADDLEEALFGPWRYQRELPVLGWDATSARDHALRARDPSQEKKTGVPGADWLACLGLRFFPVAPVQTPGGVVLQTTGCSGGWKSGSFTWPLWERALLPCEIATLLSLPRLLQMSERERQARGVVLVLSCGIRRSDQGGYGSFAPGRVV